MTEPEYRVYRIDRREVSRELSRRVDKVHIVALVLMIIGLCAFACSIFFGWPVWIHMAFVWSGWSCMCSADYIKGAVMRTVFI